MAKGQRLKPKQILTLLCQIDVVLTICGKNLAKACKEVVRLSKATIAGARCMAARP